MPRSISLSRGAMSYDDTPENAGKPVLVWLHAFPQDRAMWESQLGHFAASHRVLAPDWPGFGDSAPGRPWSIDSAADLIADWLTALHITEPVVVGGLSMGGYVAMAFARRHPAKLKALILADTKADPDDDAAKAGREKTIALAREKGAAGVIEAMLPRLLGATTLAKSPEVADRVRTIATRQSTEGVVAGLEALRDRPDATPGLRSIAVPTLVIVGAEDLVTPLEKARVLAGEIPGAALVTLPGVGHLANLEDPAGFNQAVGAFLAKIG